MLDGRVQTTQLMRWAKLLKRLLEIDLAHCSSFGSALNVIAAILETPVIKKILTHLSWHAPTPPRAPARGQALQAA